MAMDKLEEYIMKHREEMDRYKPSPSIWRKTGNELKTGMNLRWLSIAAMLAVILGTTLVLYRPGAIRSQQSVGENNYKTIMKNNPQLRETEIYYNNLANSLYREATPMLARYPEINRELFTDISQLDSICTEIKKDLKDNVANQDVIEALIQNYRLKINLLEDMLEVLKEYEKNPEKRNDNEL
jgi:hypothetical protein